MLQGVVGRLLGDAVSGDSSRRALPTPALPRVQPVSSDSRLITPTRKHPTSICHRFPLSTHTCGVAKKKYEHTSCSRHSALLATYLASETVNLKVDRVITRKLETTQQGGVCTLPGDFATQQGAHFISA